MKLKQIKCLTCGSSLSFSPDSKEVTCKFCSNTFLTSEDTEVKYTRTVIEVNRMKEIHNQINKIGASFSNLIEDGDNVFIQVDGLEQIIELRKLIFEN